MKHKAWLRVALLGAAALLLGIAACAGGQGGPSGEASGASSTTGTATTVDASQTTVDHWDESFDATSVPETLPPTSAAPLAIPLERTLGKGVAGDDVLRVQERLVELGFDPGKPDGVYGPQTISAVWAYEKLVMGRRGSEVTGQVTPELWERMVQPSGISPRRTNTTSTHFEVYLPEQVAVLFKDGQVRLVTHISTGSGQEWCEEGRCGISVTPGGVYKFYRRESDWWEGSLGRMYNPVYFNYGIAVHGMTSVPNYPASHGCVRIPMHVADYFPSLVRRGDQVFVWDGVKEPERYGAQPPIFDRPDPDATTTSSSSSSTSTTSTTSTTVKVTTTTPKPATTLPPTTPKPTAPPTTPKPTTTAPATTAAPTTSTSTAPASTAPTASD